MSIPVLEELMKACQRRNAIASIMQAKAIHAGVAPVMCGKPGVDAFNSFVESLNKIIRDADGLGEDNGFEELYAAMEKQQMQAGVMPSNGVPPRGLRFSLLQDLAKPLVAHAQDRQTHP